MGRDDTGRVRELVLAHVNPEVLVNLAVGMGNTPSPKGREKEIGDYVYDWLHSNKFRTSKQIVVEDRANVIAVLPGAGGGRTLIFNAHMDTAQWGPEDIWVVGEEKPYYNEAWVHGGKVYGEGVVNDKGPLAATIMAALAIRESGVRLRGDVVITAVVGEIGQAPVDEFQGGRYLGKGHGAKFMVEHGLWGDAALVAEATNFGMTWAEAGCAFYKITVTGERIYTPFIPRPLPIEKNPNAIVKAARLIGAIEEWAVEYEQKNAYPFDGMTIVPKVNVGAVRGGLPFSPIVTSAVCSLYVDVRLTPASDVGAIGRDLEEILRRLGIPGRVELYMAKRGYVGTKIEGFRSSIERAHRALFGTMPGGVTPGQTSMWRDVNAFNGVGIPAITYGPGSSLAQRGDEVPHLTVEGLTDAAKVYALIACDFCGVASVAEAPARPRAPAAPAGPARRRRSR